MQRTFGELLRRISSYDFQERWQQEVSRKILHAFHSARNKTSTAETLGAGGAKILQNLVKACSSLLSRPSESVAFHRYKLCPDLRCLGARDSNQDPLAEPNRAKSNRAI